MASCARFPTRPPTVITEAEGVSAPTRRRATSPTSIPIGAVARPPFDHCCEGNTCCATSECTSRARGPGHPRQPGSPRKYCAFLSDQRISYPGPGSPVREFLLRNIYWLRDIGGMPAAHFKPARQGGRRGRGVNGDPVERHSFRHPRPEGCVQVRASARVHAANGRILRSGRSSRGGIDLNIGQVVDVPNTTLSAVLPLDILDRRSASSRPGLEIFRHWPIFVLKDARRSALWRHSNLRRCFRWRLATPPPA
jgi:hypothetical protein